jgi:mannose-1-phosphate guanylyltransferase
MCAEGDHMLSLSHSGSHAAAGHHWAAVLAGGNGTRLESLTRYISGDNRPKQFCPIVGGRTLLDQTRRRLLPLFTTDRTMFLLNHEHREFYSRELHDVDGDGLLIQPMNRGTAAAIALAVVKIWRRDEDSVMGVFPSDHYYSDDHAFSRTIRLGLTLADECPRFVILIGARARYPETDYGWIETGAELGTGTRLFEVRGFHEKPRFQQARRLWRQGELWNTFVMIGRARAFLELLRTTVPRLVDAVERAVDSGDLTPGYTDLEALDFSRAVLAAQSRRSLVLCDGESGWTDVGTPERVVETLIRNGLETPRAGTEHKLAQRRERVETKVRRSKGNPVETSCNVFGAETA